MAIDTNDIIYVKVSRNRITSIRLYKGELNSTNYEENVAGIIYPKETTVLYSASVYESSFL